MYYEVGPEAIQFTNKFLAAHHAGSKNLSMRFNMYDAAFDKVDWSRDPAFTWNQLLDIRARQIEAKNKPIILYFSGGTDSYTIYKVFERNQIRLDAIYVRIRPDSAEGTWDKVYELFNSGLYNRGTRLIIDNDHNGSLVTAYKSPDWLWNGGFRQIFSLISADAYSHDYVKSVLGRDDFISVVGHEKPRLKITTNAVYSYQDDDNMCRLMTLPRFDSFYISPELPELHVKQSYMMLNYIKSQSPDAVSPKDVMHYQNLHSPIFFNWHDYSIKASGRFGDLSLSHLQHQGNAQTTMTLPASGKFDGSEVTGRPAKWFQDFYKTNKDTFNNFINGYMSVLSDTAGKFLQQDPTNVFNLKHFTSKMYRMTF
jgi:hypothetical protein